MVWRFLWQLNKSNHWTETKSGARTNSENLRGINYNMTCCFQVTELHMLHRLQEHTAHQTHFMIQIQKNEFLLIFFTLLDWSCQSLYKTGDVVKSHFTATLFESWNNHFTIQTPVCLKPLWTHIPPVPEIFARSCTFSSNSYRVPAKVVNTSFTNLSSFCLPLLNWPGLFLQCCTGDVLDLSQRVDPGLCWFCVFSSTLQGSVYFLETHQTSRPFFKTLLETLQTLRSCEQPVNKDFLFALFVSIKNLHTVSKA